MHYSTLPDTDLNVSKICLGTMTYGEQNTESEAHEQLDYSIANGVNFIDTAELYSSPIDPAKQGSTERFIGNWLKNRGKRDDLIIASKIAGKGVFAQHIRPNLNYGQQNIEDAVNKSLQRLQTDYLDLYQLHWPMRNTNFFGPRAYKHDDNDEWEDNLLEVLQGLDNVVKSGKIRYIGVSNETPWGMMRYLQLAKEHNLSKCVTIQNPYSLLNRTFEVGLSEICMREDVRLLAYSPLAAGLLSGKYHLKTDSERDRINKYSHRMRRYKKSTSWEATARYLKIAQDNDMTLSQMALAFVNQQPFLGSNIIGATTMAQLKENIESANVTLHEEVLKLIEEVQEAIPNSAP